MSRRRHVDYDDDYYDDGYYDEEEEEEEQAYDDTSQCVWGANHAGNEAQESSQSELLDALAEEFRVCLGDASIPRDQVDAVLVAADYDVDSAIQIIRQQLSTAEAESRESAARLEASQPSAIARMLENEAGEEKRPDLPRDLQSPLAAQRPPNAFAFDEPSPDDVVQLRKKAGRARAQAVGSSVVPTTGSHLKNILDSSGKRDCASKGSGVKKGTLEMKEAKGSGRSGNAVLQATGSPKSQAELVASATPGTSVPATAPKQRLAKMKIPSCNELAARCPSVSIVVAGHVDAGKVSVGAASLLVCGR